MKVKENENVTRLLAQAVTNAVIQCMVNALLYPDRKIYWLNQALKFETKFTTRYGKHYFEFVPEYTSLV